MLNNTEKLIIIRGGGDLASGTIHRLAQCGFPVLVLETARPSAIRRQVAFSEAVYDGSASLEDVLCQKAETLEEALEIIKKGNVALLVDEACSVLKQIRPWALIDGILAKKNLGTRRDMADKTIALGPGFTAGKDVDLVIETKRGHNLGRILTEGCAAPNTGIPGLIGGYGTERVIHSPTVGIIHPLVSIGVHVEKGQLLATIEEQAEKPQTATADNTTAESLSPAVSSSIPVHATLTGLLRGMIRDGYPVTKGFKIADIDPREEEYENCFTISDKARCISGSVLAGLLFLEKIQASGEKSSPASGINTSLTGHASACEAHLNSEMHKKI